MSRIKRYHSEDLVRLLQTRRIGTMDELKEALGTTVDVTVFRKLKELHYHTSYSHRGRYYTLDEIAEFDYLGLWSFRSVWFSRHGTLLRTAVALVERSDAGYFADELENILNVGVQDPLRKLVREERLVREWVAGRFLYISVETATRMRQLLARRVVEADLSLGTGPIRGGTIPDELKAAIVLFFSVLDEKQRRLYAGLEAFKWGHGGDRQIADLLGIDVGTVAKGRRELLGQDVEVGRIRKPGGGRKPVEKKHRKSSPESGS